jgi:hypothetical protein
MVRARDMNADVYCDVTTQQLAKGKAVYRQLKPVQVKGRQQPVEVFEVSSLDSEATVGRASLLQSPLGAKPLAPAPAVAAAAAAEAAVGLHEARGRRGSSVPQPRPVSARPSVTAVSPQDSAGALESLASALAPQLLQLEEAAGAEQAPEQTGAPQPDSQGLGQVVGEEERVVPSAPPLAAPGRVAPNTPLVGERRVGPPAEPARPSQTHLILLHGLVHRHALVMPVPPQLACPVCCWAWCRARG